MKLKKTGLLTKLVVLALLVGLTVTLLEMRDQIAAAEARKAELENQISIQTQVNADLQDAVDHSDDPGRQMDIARDELGLVTPGEKVFRVTD